MCVRVRVRVCVDVVCGIVNAAANVTLWWSAAIFVTVLFCYETWQSVPVTVPLMSVSVTISGSFYLSCQLCDFNANT